MNDRKNEIAGEITARKSLLSNTDYQLFKLVENMTDCEDIAELVALFADFKAEFGTLVTNRRAWRSEINTLEAELETLDETPAAE